MILVNTSVWIDFLEGGQHWTKVRLKQRINDRESIAYMELILLEIIQGIRKKEDRAIIEKQFEGFIIILPHKRSTTLLAANIYQELQRKGIRIRSIIDCMIAAAALEAGTVVLHKDRDLDNIAKYYPIVCELKNG